MFNSLNFESKVTALLSNISLLNTPTNYTNRSVKSNITCFISSLFYIMKFEATIFCLLPAAWPFINTTPLQRLCTSLKHTHTLWWWGHLMWFHTVSCHPQVDMSFLYFILKGLGSPLPHKSFVLCLTGGMRERLHYSQDTRKKNNLGTFKNGENQSSNWTTTYIWL